MSAHEPADGDHVGSSEFRKLAQAHALLGLLTKVDASDIGMSPDLAFELQELYEDLANAYLGISEVLRAYVAEQKARSAVISSGTGASRDGRDRYPS